MQCVNPREQEFTVIHTNGIHRVTICYCDCDCAVSRRQQLLRHRWYPATVHVPQTCATFEVLNQFHLLTLTSKLAVFAFYTTLERLTDNTGLDVPRVSD